VARRAALQASASLCGWDRAVAAFLPEDRRGATSATTPSAGARPPAAAESTATGAAAADDPGSASRASA
jgi:hypothetical protein